jgi:hypothetical protein
MPWEGKGTFANTRGPREKKKELIVLPELGCLATYIGYVSRVSTYLC